MTRGEVLQKEGGGVEKNRLAGHMVARDESLRRQNEIQPLTPKKLKRKFLGVVRTDFEV